MVLQQSLFPKVEVIGIVSDDERDQLLTMRAENPCAPVGRGCPVSKWKKVFIIHTTAKIVKVDHRSVGFFIDFKVMFLKMIRELMSEPRRKFCEPPEGMTQEKATELYTEDSYHSMELSTKNLIVSLSTVRMMVLEEDSINY